MVSAQHETIKEGLGRRSIVWRLGERSTREAENVSAFGCLTEQKIRRILPILQTGESSKTGDSTPNVTDHYSPCKKLIGFASKTTSRTKMSKHVHPSLSVAMPLITAYTVVFFE